MVSRIIALESFFFLLLEGFFFPGTCRVGFYSMNSATVIYTDLLDILKKN